MKLLIDKFEPQILDAVHKDLHKSETETYTSEIFYVQNEIKYFIKNLKKLSKPKKYHTPLINKPGKSFVIREPYGTTLVISPWNYPFGLLFSPIVGAMAAGNCIIAKPSELSVNTSRLINKMISENFPAEYFTVVEGDAAATQEIIRQNVDYIFFTGSTNVGREIMKSAADKLIPLTLELGGKNPSIVDSDIDIDVAVKRILWGKFFNSGQTCIAPDYVLIDSKIEKEFTEKSIIYLEKFYGNIDSPESISHVINEMHFNRITGLMNEGNIVAGGHTDLKSLYISPTLIKDLDFDSEIMQNEVFGPVLPIIIYNDLGDVLKKLRTLPKPLSLYFFSRDKKKQDYIIKNTDSGSISINGTIHIILSGNLPFGGVGHSGLGIYHGSASFETFSRQRSILKKSFHFDSKYLYPPYKTPLKLLKKVLKYFY